MKKIILLFGPQGSGKSTQGKLLAEKFGWTWISAGNVLRAAAKTDTELQGILDRGEIAPVDFTNKLMFDTIKNADSTVLVDGFPRVLGQVGPFLKTFGAEAIEKVVFINLSESESLKRLLNRGRNDDNEDSIRGRLAIYHKETLPLINLFRENGIEIVEIDGDQTVEQVEREIEEKL